jgi:hypothetical protein
MWAELVKWFSGLFGGTVTMQGNIGKGNQSVTGSTTGQNAPILTAGNTIYYHGAPPTAEDKNAAVFTDLESSIPDLLADLRNKLREDPLTRDVIAMRLSTYEYCWPNDHWGYFEDKMPGVLAKLRLLEDYGLLEVLKKDFAYRISPILVAYLRQS